MESLNIWQDVLLNSINAELVDFYDTLKLDSATSKLDAENLSNSTEFINSLNSIGLKKSQLQNTDDFETFINKPCRFFLIYNIESNELENPKFLVFQTWNQSLRNWEDAKLYRIGDNIQKFYDKLTSRTIEIIDGDQNYIYVTSNGNDWQLQNLEKENDVYKRILRKEELQTILDDKKVTLNII
jgi:site-specific DNA-adenine methylase